MAHLASRLNIGSLATHLSQSARGNVLSIRSGGTGVPRTGAGDADITSFLQILRKHWTKIAGLTALAALASLLYLATATPLYTATASLFIDPQSRTPVAEPTVQAGYGTDLALVESQVAILTSDAVLGRVVDTLKLADDPEYAPARSNGLLSRIKRLIVQPIDSPDPAALARYSLAQSIKVKRAQKTYVVDVEVTASQPTKAARVAQAVLDAYLADQTAAKSAEAKRANSLLDSRLGELRDQVRRAELKVDEYKKANNIVTSEGGVVTEQQLTKLNTELITARAVAAEARARHDQIQSALKSGASPDVLSESIRSGLIQKLREQYAQVARREAALSSQLQARHPVLIDVRSQLAEVKAQINAELKRISIAAQAEYEIAANRERDLSAQLDKAKQDVTTSNTAQIKARELEQDVTASRELLKLFLARAKETQEQQNISTPDARIITPPAVPSRPSKPVSMLVLGLGILGGLGLGIAAALIADHMDGSVRSISQLTRETGLSQISSLPALPAKPFKTRSSSAAPGKAAQFSDLLAAVADTKGRGETQYRQAVLRLLSKIKAQQRPGRPHTVMFASPHAGLGNSAATLSVAYAAALAGERVLLVDATSTNPQLSEIFATSLKPSTVVILDSKEHLAQITTRDARSGLAFLPIALADLRTLKTQQRRRLVAGLNGLSQSYDLVFIDAGAVLEDEAATSLLPAADQVLIVGRAGVTSADDIAQTLEILEPAREAVSGGVLTMSAETV